MSDLVRRLEELGDPGGAVHVLRGGDVVEDLSWGTSDGTRPWAEDTLVMTYSAAKPFAALAVLSVVVDGALGLDQRVSEVWPEYGVRGKEATTVRHVLTHQAGLPCFPESAADVAFDDVDGLTALLADAEPDHVPGEGIAEHALTYGHLCGELVRKSTGQDLEDVFAGIAAAHGWDLHLRVGPGDRDRVADVEVIDPAWSRDYLADPAWGPALGRPTGLLDPEVLNSERWRGARFAAVNLHASARGLATFYDQLLDPAGPVADLLGPDLHRGFVTAQATGPDRVLRRDVSWTLGLQVDEEDLGMGGAGGSAGWYSLVGGYAAAYVSRGLGDHERSDAVWDWLEKG